MKKRTILAIGAICALVVGIVIAADLTYTTLPQTGDSELVLAHKYYTAQTSNKFTNSTIPIAAGTASTIKSTSGVLERLTVNTGAAGTVTLYNNASGTGSKIAVIGSTASAGTFPYGCRFDTGLSIVQTGSADVTVIWR